MIGLDGHAVAGEPGDRPGGKAHRRVGAVVVVDLGIRQAGAVVDHLMQIVTAQPGRLVALMLALQPRGLPPAVSARAATVGDAPPVF
jgi:hypothetical protein